MITFTDVFATAKVTCSLSAFSIGIFCETCDAERTFVQKEILMNFYFLYDLTFQILTAQNSDVSTSPGISVMNLTTSANVHCRILTLALKAESSVPRTGVFCTGSFAVSLMCCPAVPPAIWRAPSLRQGMGSTQLIGNQWKLLSLLWRTSWDRCSVRKFLFSKTTDVAQMTYATLKC